MAFQSAPEPLLTMSDLSFMPISAQTGVGIKDRVPKALAPWFDGPSLLEYLDEMKTLERKINAPFMMPISGKYRVSDLKRSLFTR